MKMKSYASLTCVFVAAIVSISAIPTLSPTSDPATKLSLAPTVMSSTSTPSGSPTPETEKDQILKEGLACVAFVAAIPGLATLTGKCSTEV